jgi:hypothetical protein
LSEEARLPDQNPPSRWQALRTRMAGAIPNIWTFVKSWFWQGAAAVLVLAFILAIVRPFETTPEPDAEDVATAWNQSISRLGILPIFPPEEDFHVGDVWAVVADAEETPLLGKAVRIAHIDIREQIKEARNQQPVFAETADLKQGEKFRRQDRLEITQTGSDDGRIALTLSAFPGITITHATRAAGSLGASLGGLGAGRDDQEIEEVRIPTAETYGVSVPAAFFRLDDWCSDAKTKIYCTDEFVRRVIAFAVSDRALATRDGQYLARLQLRLVTRVFLTREIEHRRRQNIVRGGAVQASSDPSKSTPAASPPPATANVSESGLGAQNSANLTALAQQTGVAAASRAPEATASLLRGDSTEIGIRDIFQRPVAFGYRAITISLAPAIPSKETPP